MKPRQQPRKFHLQPADERPRTYQLQFTSMCGKCPDWSYVANSTEEGKQAFAEHQKQHPDSVDRGQRARRRAAGQILRSPRNQSK